MRAFETPPDRLLAPSRGDDRAPASTVFDRPWVRLIAHELGGPISLLRGYSELWLDGSLGDEAAGLGELGRCTWPDVSTLTAELQLLLIAGRLVPKEPGQDPVLSAAVWRFQAVGRPAVERLLAAIELWLREARGRAPAAASSSVRTCHSKALLLSGLVGQLALAVGIDADPDTGWELVDLAGWLRHLAHEIAGALAATGHRLVVKTEAGPTEAEVRLELIQAAVLNLLDNAQKHSPAASPIVLSVAAAGEDVAICVSDRGPGLPDDLQPTLFGRIDQPAAFDQPGLGLGLGIARQVALHHGGELDYNRRQGGGAAFTLLIPRRR